MSTYSILYSNSEGDIFFTEYAIDWDWLVTGLWACSEKEIGTSWYLTGELDNKAYLALLKHFGLDYYEIPLEKIISMSPAELTARRREKEEKHGLRRKEMINQKLGDHQPAEVFD